MKKFTTIIFIFFIGIICKNGYSQTIDNPRAFPDSNYSWNEQYDYIDFEFNIYLSHQLTYYDAGDTIINGFNYRKLNIIDVFIDYDWSNVGPGNPYPVFISNDEGLFAFIRNDKANKKVYLMYEGETEEKLLFDFELKYKDTVKMDYFNTFDFNYFVVGVDSIVDPNGITRKYFEISDNLADTIQFGGISNSILIEGIGLSFGIYINKLTIPFERVFPELICIKLDEDRKYYLGGSNLLNTADSCNHTKFQYLGINNNKQIDIRIFPNPADDYIQFNLDSELDNVEIFDSKLSLVISKQNLSEKFIDVSTLATGIYFTKVTTKNSFYTSKFIKK